MQSLCSSWCKQLPSPHFISAHPLADADLPTFEVVGTFDPASKAVSAVPAEYAPGASGSHAASSGKAKGKAAADDKGKGKASAAANSSGADKSVSDDGLAMATMDIFAGCGGLSEGMHQAGVADTRWAIEYEAPAADAFKLNNPNAEVFCANCNVILRVRAAACRGFVHQKDCLGQQRRVEQVSHPPSCLSTLATTPAQACHNHSIIVGNTVQPLFSNPLFAICVCSQPPLVCITGVVSPTPHA